jgi:hypothetical protein
MLESFHHEVIMRILGITMQMAHDEKITNLQVRHRFLKIPKIINFVKRRVIRYTGKVVREEKEKALHKYFMAVYCH